MHAIAFGLSSLGIGQRTAQAELSPIELLVMAPPPQEIEEPPEANPAELSHETYNPAPTAMARANPQPVAAPSPQPAELFQPEPQPIPETNVESQLTEPEKTEEPEDTPEDTSEEIAAATDELDASQIESLRDFFERPPTTVPDTTSTDEAATTGTGESSPSTGDGEETAISTGTDTDEGTNTTGNGTGQGQGSRTVACQNCAQPQYPQSALEAGVEGTPRVQVDINPDGTVRSVTLVQSSGNAAIDQAAIQAARNSSFQPMAGGASVPIEYDLTIEGSRRNREAQRRGNRRSIEVPSEETATPPQTVRDDAAADTTPNPSDAEAGPNPAQDNEAGSGAASDTGEGNPSTESPNDAAPNEPDAPTEEPTPAANEVAPQPANDPGSEPSAPAPVAEDEKPEPQLPPEPEPQPASQPAPVPPSQPAPEPVPPAPEPTPSSEES